MALSIFVDRPHLREEMRDDALAAGFRVVQAVEVASLLEGAPRPLGEVVLIDCPAVDGGVLAALARLDLRAAHSGAQLVVSTSVAALDDVFACMDQSDPQILVDPSRAERVIALGRVPRLRLRELAQPRPRGCGGASGRGPRGPLTRAKRSSVRARQTPSQNPGWQPGNHF